MSEVQKIPFTAELIEGFAGVFLSPMYDNPQPTAPYHRECWKLYCSPALLVAIAAPREHAKSTALTHDFGLASALFRIESHIMVCSASEELAMAHLSDIAKELRENEDLRTEFGIDKFLTDAKGEIIIRCNDGYEFRFIARGSGQKLRGLKWNGRRPGLILCDDMEDDEQVENPDRRRKFRRWVLRALLPMGRRGCKIRWHGTIMHEDAMLARLMKDSTWVSRRFKAHRSFDEFTDILWPEQFPEERLRAIRQRFINQMDAGGYSQEYLNDPLDNEDAYLKKDWLLPMTEDDLDLEKLKGAAADFAISKADSANRTSITVGGKDQRNLLHVFDQRVGRWDSEEIVEEIFAVHEQHNPDFFWVESGQIWLGLWPMLRKEMQVRNRWINFITRTPIKDKATRGRTFQKRARAGGMRWNKFAEWYTPYEEEILRFTGTSDATLDDQFDSTALLALGFEELPEVDEEDFEAEESRDMRANDPRAHQGRNEITGY